MWGRSQLQKQAISNCLISLVVTKNSEFPSSRRLDGAVLLGVLHNCHFGQPSAMTKNGPLRFLSSSQHTVFVVDERHDYNNTQRTDGMITFSDIEVQIPLIHIVESDDVYLEAQEDVFWFHLLRDLDWQPLRSVAAGYYEALWQFNDEQAKARAEPSSAQAANGERDIPSSSSPAATTHRSSSSRHLMVKTGFLFAGSARDAGNVTAGTWGRVA